VFRFSLSLLPSQDQVTTFSLPLHSLFVGSLRFSYDPTEIHPSLVIGAIKLHGFQLNADREKIPNAISFTTLTITYAHICDFIWVPAPAPPIIRFGIGVLDYDYAWRGIEYRLILMRLLGARDAGKW